MKGWLVLLWVFWIVVLLFGLGGVVVVVEFIVKVVLYENLMVLLFLMGWDILVVFLVGGLYVVYLLDVFNVGLDVSNWVIVGNVMNMLVGKGILVVVLVGGVYSMYINWEQDGSKQWDIFLFVELFDWLVVNWGLVFGGYVVVGVVQGGYGVMVLVVFYFDCFGFVGLMLGFLYLLNIIINGVIVVGMQ